MGAQRVKLTSEMQYIQDAIRTGRATLQKFSMKELRKPDPSFQPRVVHINMDHVKVLGDILQNLLKVDRDLEPGVIFRDSKTGWKALVDGFHRHEAYRLAKLPYFPAYVIEGTKDEAIEYAAMANQHAMLKRTPEDVRKQIYMLLDTEKWFVANDTQISAHVGCATSTAKKYRTSFCVERGVEAPTTTVSNGRRGPYIRRKRVAKDIPIVREEVFKNRNNKERIYFSANIGKKNVYLGRSVLEGPERDRKREKAKERLMEILCVKRDDAEQRRLVLNRVNFVPWLYRNGVVVDRTRFDGNKYPGVSCLLHDCGIINTCDSYPSGMIEAVGSLFFARQILASERDTSGDGRGCRLILVCYHEGKPLPLAEVAEQLGVEFLTPEELVASIKGDGGKPTPTAKGDLP